MRRHFKALAIAVTTMLLSSSVATTALSQSMPFTATVGQSPSCTIVVNRNGTLVPNGAGTILSSKLAGGRSGEALVTPQNGIYTVSANHYNIWRSGPEPLIAPNTTFQPSHSGTYRGRTLYGERTTPIRLRAIRNRIAYLMDIDLVVSKDPGFSFAEGSYQSEVVVLCE